MSKPNIYQRIHNVMTGIETLAKNGYNDFQRYKYATEADYVKALRPLFKEHGLVVIPEIVGEQSVKESVNDKGKNSFLTSISVKFTIVNVDNPEEKVIAVVPAQGSDAGDKGVYKALTGAKKYFAALTFLVATGDDPEKDEPPNRRIVRKGKSKRTEASDEDEF